MTRARLRAILLVAIGALAIAALALAMNRHGPQPVKKRPVLLLLTSLPLVFGEDFSLDQPPSPVMQALREQYRVVPISVADGPELARGRLLLMAQPLAQPAEDLVTLDKWVRGGGRVLLLADPLLEWPSTRPLGDPLRPAPMFMDTGLLAHWGLRLDAPDKRGEKAARLGGVTVMTVSPGLLFGRCPIDSDRLVAHCTIGRGKATIVADADFLDLADLGSAGDHNLNGLVAELASLRQK